MDFWICSLAVLWTRLMSITKSLLCIRRCISFFFVYVMCLNITSYLYGNQIKSKFGIKLYLWMIFIRVHLNWLDLHEWYIMTLKAILQVLIYKALYDKSYLGSKTTMTSGEWTCLISFVTALLTCSERGGSEKFKMKIYVSSGIRTHNPFCDRKVAAP